MTRYYLAYGSNLDSAQMRRRCPSARAVAAVQLKGYRLTFSGHSKTWGGGVASLTRDARAQTPAVLYALSAKDERRLDAFEGYPFAYAKRTTRVLGRGKDSKSAFFYVQPAREVSVPSIDYLLVIVRAYREHGFDPKPLLRAARSAA